MKSIFATVFIVVSLVRVIDADEPDRRGYRSEVPIRDAIRIYNEIQAKDIILTRMPPLRDQELQSSIQRASVPGSVKGKLRTEMKEDLARLRASIKQGVLPKGALISFQRPGRTSVIYNYPHPKLNEEYGIFLWMNLDMNPSGDYEYDSKARIWAIPIRTESLRLIDEKK